MTGQHTGPLEIALAVHQFWLGLGLSGLMGSCLKKEVEQEKKGFEWNPEILVALLPFSLRAAPGVARLTKCEQGHKTHRHIDMGLCWVLTVILFCCR